MGGQAGCAGAGSTRQGEEEADAPNDDVGDAKEVILPPDPARTRTPLSRRTPSRRRQCSEHRGTLGAKHPYSDLGRAAEIALKRANGAERASSLCS